MWRLWIICRARWEDSCAWNPVNLENFHSRKGIVSLLLWPQPPALVEEVHSSCIAKGASRGCFPVLGLQMNPCVGSRSGQLASANVQWARWYCRLPACPFPICWRCLAKSSQGIQLTGHWCRDDDHAEATMWCRVPIIWHLVMCVCLSIDAAHWRRACCRDALKWHLLAVQKTTPWWAEWPRATRQTQPDVFQHTSQDILFDPLSQVLAVLVSHWEQGYFSQLVSRLLTMGLK